MAYHPGRTALETLKRSELQKLCKRYEIKGANQKNEVLVKLLDRHLSKLDAADGASDAAMLVVEEEHAGDVDRTDSPVPVKPSSSRARPPTTTKRLSAPAPAAKRSKRTAPVEVPVREEEADGLLVIEAADEQEAGPSRSRPSSSAEPPVRAASVPQPTPPTPSQSSATPQLNDSRSSLAPAGSFAGLTELAALTPMLLQLQPHLATLLSLPARVDTLSSTAIARHQSLQSAIDTTSSSLNSVWAEVGGHDGRLDEMQISVDGLKGSVENLWRELNALDVEKDGFLRKEDVLTRVKALEDRLDEKLENFRAQTISSRTAGSQPQANSSTAGLRSPPGSDTSVASLSASTLPRFSNHVASSLGKHGRSELSSTALSGTSRSMPPPPHIGSSSSSHISLLSALGHPASKDSDGHVSKRQRVVSVAQSEMAVEGILGDDAVSDVRAGPSHLASTSSPACQHPPSTPPPRASPSLQGPDPTYTPSAPASASVKANKANPNVIRNTFATSPRPPRQAPTSPSFTSPHRIGQPSTGGLSLTPGRAMFIGTDTPRSRAARLSAAPGSAQLRLPSDPMAGPSATIGSPAGGRALNFDGAPAAASQAGARASPAPLGLLPSLPLVAPAEDGTAATPPSTNVDLPSTTLSSLPFSFLNFPTPPPVRPPPRGVPPTPPAPRTMFGTERDRDDRFGDDEA